MAVPIMRPRRPKAVQRSSRPSADRHARKRVKYTEPASDPEEDVSDDDFEPEQTRSLPRRTRSTAPLHPSRPSNSPRKRKAPTQIERSRRAKTGRVRPFGYEKVEKDPAKGALKKKTEIHFTGKTMPWQTLPYHVLELVFDYASYPLIAENFAPSASPSWLVQIARLCRGFAEPALTVLYACPPLFPPARVRKLIDALEAQDESSFMNYKAKIKRIDLEAVEILGRKSDSPDSIDLSKMLKHTSQLRGMGIHLLSDNPRYHQKLASRRNGAYPFQLIEILRHGEIKLRDWTWNSHLERFETWPAALPSVHYSRGFQSIQSLKLVNYEQKSFNLGGKTLQEPKIPRHTSTLLPPALEALTNLKHLAFYRSDVLDYMKMEDLPSGLHTLEINDCPIECRHLDSFLQAKGHSLRNLILNHNQHLNLSWMDSLSVSCPNLENLHMDLIYHSAFVAVQNIEPQYESLLTPFNAPSWPKKLRSIELYHLRKWTMDIAGTFLQSLVDAAHDLPDLRQIRIKASIRESGWRERKRFKDTWVETLDEIFLRKSEPPNPNWTSIAAYKDWKKRQASTKSLQSAVKVQIPVRTSTVAQDADTNDSNKPLRSDRSIRRSQRTKNPAQTSQHLTTTSSPQPSTHRRHRKRRSGASSAEDSSLEDDPELLALSRANLNDTGSSSDEDGDKETFVQGKCDVVDLKIDSQRPTEEQLHESDFLDEEISGDEDWNGDDDFDEEEGVYAW